MNKSSTNCKAQISGCLHALSSVSSVSSLCFSLLELGKINKGEKTVSCLYSPSHKIHTHLVYPLPVKLMIIAVVWDVTLYFVVKIY